MGKTFGSNRNHKETWRDKMSEINKIMVCKKDESKEYFLRIFLDADRGGIIPFETTPGFSKSEADYRAVQLSSIYGWKRDELPTYPYLMESPGGEG